MNAKAYTEDHFVEQPAIGLAELCWQTASAMSLAGANREVWELYAGQIDVNYQPTRFPRGSNAVPRRLTDERADSVNRRLEGVLSEQAEALASGALILVEDARYRIRRLPIQ